MDMTTLRFRETELIDDKGVVKGTCKTVLAGFDKRTNSSAPIDENFKRRFLDFEAN